MMNKVHPGIFEKCFVQHYYMIHRIETNKLRNVAKFFAHLLGTVALPWHVLAYTRFTKVNTTSSSCIFIKNLIQVGKFIYRLNMVIDLNQWDYKKCCEMQQQELGVNIFIKYFIKFNLIM